MPCASFWGGVPWSAAPQSNPSSRPFRARHSVSTGDETKIESWPSVFSCRSIIMPILAKTPKVSAKASIFSSELLAVRQAAKRGAESWNPDMGDQDQKQHQRLLIHPLETCTAATGLMRLCASSNDIQTPHYVVLSLCSLFASPRSRGSACIMNTGSLAHLPKLANESIRRILFAQIETGRGYRKLFLVELLTCHLVMTRWACFVIMSTVDIASHFLTSLNSDSLCFQQKRSSMRLSPPFKPCRQIF